MKAETEKDLYSSSVTHTPPPTTITVGDLCRATKSSALVYSGESILVSKEGSVSMRHLHGGLPEMWMSGGQMSGEEDGTGDGSSAQIWEDKKHK